MKILITGADGHLGKRAIKGLCIGNEVHAVVRANPNNALSSITYHAIDLSADWSTKVLPDNIDEFSEENSSIIAEGGSAAMAYARLQYENLNEVERLKIKESLLRYCELDTLAMIMVIQAWNHI